MTTESVCAVDGVKIGLSRSGAMVHLDEIPKGIDADHEIVIVEPREFSATEAHRQDLHSAVADLLLHHGTLHPLSDCEFAARVTGLLRSGR